MGLTAGDGLTMITALEQVVIVQFPEPYRTHFLF